MMSEYDRPPAAAGALRLHLNENTGGCSATVLDTLRRLTREDAAFYPDYDAAYAAVAARLGVPADWLLLTNGLDEGILATTGAALRDRSRAGVPQGITLQPAFDMYEICTEALGGEVVRVPLGPEFAFPGRAIADAIAEGTRVVFLTNPHNPTGLPIARADLLAVVRRAAPALVLVDEAYIDFGGDTLVDCAILEAHPNLIVGRTFAKAYGLAGLRAGALVARPETLAPLRPVVPPYSLNSWAAAALPAAMADRVHVEWYRAQAAVSRRLLTEACGRLGLRTWPSAANFMLVHAGARAGAIARGLAARGVQVRDKSGEAGTEGCLRITTGVVDHTRRLIAALEEVACAADV
jgi:histidinol-phosphate aminotransferase